MGYPPIGDGPTNFPGGSGTQWQYRASATTFGGVANSSWDGSRLQFPPGRLGVSGGTHGNWLVEIEGGSGDDQLIRGRRNNALGGGFSIQAGSGDITFAFLTPSYTQDAAIVCDYGNADRLFLTGQSSLDKSTAAIKITSADLVRIQTNTAATSGATGGLVVGRVASQQVGIGSGVVWADVSLNVGTRFAANNNQAGLSISANQYVIFDAPSQNGAGTTGGLRFRQSSTFERSMYMTGNDGVFSFATGAYTNNQGELQIAQNQVAVAGRFMIGSNDKRIVTGASSDEDRALSFNIGASVAWIGANDVDGSDVFIETRQGGAHTASNPRGGDITLKPGLKGAGGTGRDGRVNIDGILNALQSIIAVEHARVGNTSDTTEGNIRWTGTDLECRKGGAWISLTGIASPIVHSKANYPTTATLGAENYSRLTGSAQTYTMPASPVDGQQKIIKNKGGGNNTLAGGAASIEVTTIADDESFTFIYNAGSTTWELN